MERDAALWPASAPGVRSGARGGTFVELPALRAGSASGLGAFGLPHGSGALRLSFESADGAVTVVVPAPERELVEAVRRLIVAALGDGTPA